MSAAPAAPARTIKIAGYSDDIVCLNGPGIDHEFDSYEDTVHLRFSDGTVITFAYCPEGYDGWKATVVEKGTANLDTVEASDPEGSWPAYTDQVTLTGDIRFVDVTVSHDAGEDGLDSEITLHFS